jgi:hypothetical protein
MSGLRATAMARGSQVTMPEGLALRCRAALAAVVPAQRKRPACGTHWRAHSRAQQAEAQLRSQLHGLGTGSTLEHTPDGLGAAPGPVP